MCSWCLSVVVAAQAAVGFGVVKGAEPDEADKERLKGLKSEVAPRRGGVRHVAMPFAL